MDFYCGPDWFYPWLKEILSQRFNESCFMHDLLYAEAELDRKEIDLLFLADMLGQSKNKKDIIIANLMYAAVRIFGWSRYGKN